MTYPIPPFIEKNTPIGWFNVEIYPTFYKGVS